MGKPRRIKIQSFRSLSRASPTFGQWRKITGMTKKHMRHELIDTYEQMDDNARLELDALFEELFPQAIEDARARANELMEKPIAHQNTKRRIEWLNVPRDRVRLKHVEGEFLIDALTEEEYKALVDAGVSFLQTPLGNSAHEKK